MLYIAFIFHQHCTTCRHMYIAILKLNFFLSVYTASRCVHMTTVPPWRSGEFAFTPKPPSGKRAREPPWPLLKDTGTKAKVLKRKASEVAASDNMAEGDDESEGKWKSECLKLAEMVMRDKWDDAEVTANALYMWRNSNH